MNAGDFFKQPRDEGRSHVYSGGLGVVLHHNGQVHGVGNAPIMGKQGIRVRLAHWRGGNHDRRRPQFLGFHAIGHGSAGARCSGAQGDRHTLGVGDDLPGHRPPLFLGQPSRFTGDAQGNHALAARLICFRHQVADRGQVQFFIFLERGSQHPVDAGKSVGHDSLLEVGL